MAENFTIEANDEVENFEVEFGEVTRVSNNDFNRLENRPSYAGEVMTGETSIPEVPSAVSELANDANYQTGAQVATAVGAETTARENADTALDNRLTTVEEIAGTALQPEAINKVVMTDIAVGANTSTTTFNLEAAKENLLTGATSSKQVSMPVASSTEAGIMNSSTFDAVSNNTSNINALLNGAVAITGLPAEPTQAQLTTAWETATGATALMNRAGIYDVTNGKVWTYYTNSATWYSVTNTTQVTINTFTNNSEGTIKGSTNVGQIFAETDGTGSVNGWDALNDAVSNNTSDIADLETAVDGKQDKLIAGANINIASDGKTISAMDTTYTAGNGINISAQNVISTDAPEGFFTLPATVDGEGTEITLNNTIGAKLDEVQVNGDTYQQTYSGANLYNYTDLSVSIGTDITTDDDGWITCTVDNSAGTSTSFKNYFTKPLALSPSTQYVLVLEVLSVSGTGAIAGGGDSSASQVDYYSMSFADMTSGSKYILPITSKSDITGANGLRTFFRFNAGQSGSITVRFSVLADTSVTPETFVYQPYVGGIPAPNPDYPQDIQVVTGEQTVTVSDNDSQGQSYTVNLGSTELCKIGDYRDNIFNNDPNEDWYDPDLEDNAWYVHKEIGKYNLTGQEGWRLNSGTGCFYDSGNSYLTNGGKVPSDNTILPNIVSSHFAEGTYQRIWSNGAQDGIAVAADGTSNPRIRVTGITTLTDFIDMITTKRPDIYYPLATPTDTKITDATLVGQLDALWNAMSHNGQTNFVVRASDIGALPAILELKAYQKSLNGMLGAIERTNG